MFDEIKSYMQLFKQYCVTGTGDSWLGCFPELVLR